MSWKCKKKKKSQKAGLKQLLPAGQNMVMEQGKQTFSKCEKKLQNSPKRGEPQIGPK